MALTYAGANSLLRVLCGKLSTSPYSSVYIGLSTTTPSRDGTNFTEPTGASYERQLLGSSSSSYLQKMGDPDADGGSITNDNSINEYGGKIFFPELGTNEAWGNITHIGLFSAKTDGTLIAYASLDSSITPTSGSIPMIPSESLTFSLT